MPLCNRARALGAAAALSILPASAAFAHATLETQDSPVNATYKAVVRVPHGCHGAPTLKVRVQIPEGVIAIKPMPKPGWQLETVRGPYTKTYEYFGTPMSEGVKEVVWTGRLLDEHFDEFVFRSWLTDSLRPDTTLYFPIVQECEGGQAERWIEIPADGKTRADYKHPAPGVRLGPAKATH